MASCASPLHLLGLGLMSGSLAGQTVLSSTEGQRGAFGESLLNRAIPVFRRMSIMSDFVTTFLNRYNPIGTDPGSMPDQDIALELYLENGRIKTPYERTIAWETCLLARWYDPACVPGIGSKVYLDDPMTDKEIEEALARAISSGGPDAHQITTRPYILAIHGNDQYIAVYPAEETEEIGPDHPHRKRVEAHFAERGLRYLTESPPIKIKLEDPNGQGSNLGGVGPSPSDPGHNPSVGYFRSQLLRGLGVPAEFFRPPTPPAGFVRSPITETEATRPQAQDGDGGKPPG